MLPETALDLRLAGSSLRRLDLKDNGFGPEGGAALAKTLTAHPKLREAILSDLSKSTSCCQAQRFNPGHGLLRSLA